MDWDGAGWSEPLLLRGGGLGDTRRYFLEKKFDKKRAFCAF